jgi:hypothetical protein
MMRARLLAVLAVLAALAACGAEQTARDICEEGLCAAGTPTFADGVESFTRAEVQAVAITADEPPWFAGTYNADFTIADERFGDDFNYYDPFLARTGVRRLAPLVINDPGLYPQRVVSIVPDLEDGARIFSVGEQSDTSHRVAISWFDRAGMVVMRETIALLDDARPFGGASVAIDTHGWPIVAVSGTRVDFDGDVHDGARSMIVRLGQGLRRDVLLDLAGVDVVDIAIDDDVLAIAGSYTGAPTLAEGSATWPACADPEPCGFIAAVALSSGLVHWVQPIHAPGGAKVDAVAAHASLVVGLASTATSAATDPPLGTGVLPAYLLTLDGTATGGPVLLDQTILADTDATIGGRDVAIADGGAIVVALAYTGTVFVGSSPTTFATIEPDIYASVVAELGTDLIWQWELFLESTNMNVQTVAVQDDQVAFGGMYRGRFELLNPLNVELPGEASQDNGFVLEVHR